MPSPHDLFTRMYAAFNRRDIDAVLKTFHPDVDWPSSTEGGRVQGHEAVRAYWQRQWTTLDPTVEPVSFEDRENKIVDVRVHQVVRDTAGTLLFDGFVHHVYTFHDGLVRSMTIEEDLPPASE